MVKLTPDQILSIIPASGARAETYAAPLSEAADRFTISTPARLAAFLAQVAHESGSLAHVVENLNYSAAGLQATWPKRFDDRLAASCARNPERIANIVYANRLGNGDDETGHGWKYRGRGLIQVTGLANYSACGSALDLPLLAQPELLELPSAAAMSAAWFWSTNGLNALADRGEFDAITHRVNGGANGATERQEFYDRAKRVLGA